MKDHFRHFIVEYPDLKLINSWKQKNSPTEENEVPRQINATGFVPDITEAPMNWWGGLVRSQIHEPETDKVVTYLDGNPGDFHWHYPIGMQCTVPNAYLTRGIPAFSACYTTRISLWSAINEYSAQMNNFVKCSCICIRRHSFEFDFIALIYICINIK